MDMYKFLSKAGLTAELHTIQDLQKASTECQNYYCNSIPCTSKGYVGRHGKFIGLDEVTTCPNCGGENIICVIKSKPDSQAKESA